MERVSPGAVGRKSALLWGACASVSLVDSEQGWEPALPGHPARTLAWQQGPHRPQPH